MKRVIVLSIGVLLWKINVVHAVWMETFPNGGYKYHYITDDLVGTVASIIIGLIIFIGYIKIQEYKENYLRKNKRERYKREHDNR